MILQKMALCSIIRKKKERCETMLIPFALILWYVCRETKQDVVIRNTNNVIPFKR